MAGTTGSGGDGRDTFDDPTALERPGGASDQAALITNASTVTAPGGAAAELAGVPRGTGEPPDGPDGPRPSSIAHYAISDELGRGAMGIVYKARDRKLGRKVAIKVLRDRGAKLDDVLGARLLREAQAMAKLEHPNVVTVYEVGKLADEIYIAMQYVNGPSLRRWLRERPRGWREIVETFIGAGRGLEAAHAVRLVHRDFKPENVLIDATGRARVTDFGIARQHDDVDGDRSLSTIRHLVDLELTNTGEAAGTPPYMSPEQWYGEEVGPASDQFNFCVALYEAIYGQYPYYASDGLSALLERLRTGERVRLAKDVRVPRWLHAILDRGLRVDPAQRFPSMTELLGELERQLRLEDQRRRWRRWRPFVAGAAALVIAGGVLGWWLVAARAGTGDECDAAGERSLGLWDLRRKLAIQQAFQATKVGFADRAWQTVFAHLDDQVLRLRELERSTCGLADARRTACLAKQQAQLVILLDVFAHADANVVERAVDAAQALDVRECLEPSGTLPALPQEPRRRQQVALAQERTAQAELQMLAGHLEEAKRLLDEGVTAAEVSDHAPVLAASLLIRGRLESLRGDASAARATFRRALAASEVANEPRARAQALTWLVQVVGTDLAEYSVAEEFATMAEDTIRTLHDDPVLLGTLELVRGTMALKRGEGDETVKHEQRALVLREQVLGPSHGDVGYTHILLGSGYHLLGKYDEALAEEQKGMAILEQRYGHDHPLVATALNEIGNALVARGETTRAIAMYQDAIARLEASVGPRHPDIAISLSNLGAALMAADDVPPAQVQQAVRYFERALAIERATYRGDHREVAQTLLNLGRAQRRSDRAAAARSLEEALEMDTRLGLTGAALEARRAELADVKRAAR